MKKIAHCDLWKGMTVGELISEFKKVSFTGIKLYEAATIYREMLNDELCTKFLCIAGALIPGGLRNVIIKMIGADLVDVIITTGAMITHDLIEAFGESHYHGSEYADDTLLRDQEINRIFNTFLSYHAYTTLEEGLQSILPTLPQVTMSSRQFLFELGKKVNQESILKATHEMSIPIFCPAIADSILGFQLWMYSQMNQLLVNPLLDQKELLDIVWQKNRKTGALIVGGGTPKDMLLITQQVAGKGMSYAIQITMDRPEHGGLSGAPLVEAKSWGKLEKDAKVADVRCDATIALPLLVAAILD